MVRFEKKESSAVWDAQNNKLLCEFVDGVFETGDARTIDILKDLGYEGVEIAPVSKFDGMDVEQLKAYAAEKGIDIGNSSSVNGIIKKITEAEKAE